MIKPVGSVVEARRVVFSAHPLWRPVRVLKETIPSDIVQGRPVVET